MANELMNQEQANQLMQRGFLTQEQYNQMFPVIGPQEAPYIEGVGPLNLEAPVGAATTATELAQRMNPNIPAQAAAPSVGSMALDLISKPAPPGFSAFAKDFSVMPKMPTGAPAVGLSAKPPVDLGVGEPAVAATMPETQAPVSGAMEMMRAGLAAEYTAATKKAADDVAAMENLRKEMDNADKANQERIAAAQKRSDDAMQKFNAASDELSAFQIDPSRFWSTMSTTNKIMAGIGMVLGAFGKGDVNQAAKIISDAAQNDIAIQKAQYEAKKGKVTETRNAYSTFLDIYKDERLATEAAKTAALQKAKLQLDINASQYAGGTASAQYLQASAKLAAEIESKQNEIRSLAAMGGDEAAFGLTEKQRQRYIPQITEGIAYGYAPYGSDQLVKETQQAITEAAIATKSINELKQIANTPLSSLSIEQRSAANTRVQTLIGQLRVPLTGPGVLTEQEQQRLLSILPNPTDIFSLQAKTLASLNTIEQSLKDGANIRAQAIGIKTPASKAAKVGFKPGE